MSNQQQSPQGPSRGGNQLQGAAAHRHRHVLPHEEVCRRVRHVPRNTLHEKCRRPCWWPRGSLQMTCGQGAAVSQIRYCDSAGQSRGPLQREVDRLKGSDPGSWPARVQQCQKLLFVGFQTQGSEIKAELQHGDTEGEVQAGWDQGASAACIQEVDFRVFEYRV